MPVSRARACSMLALATICSASVALYGLVFAEAKLYSDTLLQAQRVLAWLQAHPDTPAPLPVSVWIAADGRISKLEFDSLGDAQVDADLRATLQAAPLQAAPPADMRQPMRLGLLLEPK